MTKTITREKPKFDGYQAITDAIIAALEAGPAPWSKGWAGAAFDPRRANGERYKGINVLLLAAATGKHGYQSNVWLTFNQAAELGAKPRQGERSTMIVFFKPVTIGKRDGDASDDESEGRIIPMLRVYNVFNADQLDGLPDRFTTAPAPINPDTRDAIAESRLRATGAAITECASHRAYYSLGSDRITMPRFEMFKSRDDFLATLAHELCHWTGHPSRLSREMEQERESYAFEELVAEIGAAMVCNRLGVAGDHIENHAAYVGSWLKALRNDKRMIFRAASLAQKACDWILDPTENDAPPPPAGDDDGAGGDDAPAADASIERPESAYVARQRAKGGKPAPMDAAPDASEAIEPAHTPHPEPLHEIVASIRRSFEPLPFMQSWHPRKATILVAAFGNAATIEATRIGDFAVHRRLGDAGKVDPKGAWTLTHVPTGLAFPHATMCFDARRAPLYTTRAKLIDFVVRLERRLGDTLYKLRTDEIDEATARTIRQAAFAIASEDRDGPLFAA
jgi:antirestriction protein ArdC